MAVLACMAGILSDPGGHLSTMPEHGKRRHLSPPHVAEALVSIGSGHHRSLIKTVCATGAGASSQAVINASRPVVASG
jgi:hypothetical protein